MCGIVGIFDFNSKPVNEELLARMTRLLSHRGPDDEGTYVSGEIGFGHRRLSILDLSNRGHQPMSNEDGTIWITYNGEIYNHLSLRKKLIDNGHRYKSQTDTETIIHLYEEDGAGCLEYLNGDFAFAIWDANKKTVFCARDRLGVKPFYYYSSDKYFIFASEIKAILLHPEVRKQLDTQALSYYLSFSVPPAPFTFFKNIFKLETGHFLLVKKNGVLVKKQYWDAIPKEKINCSEREAIEVIHTKLKESVKERLISDVPLGVFLSGGIDSSAIVSVMSGMLNEPFKTFNVAIEGNCAYDESHSAELVSRYFKTEHNSISIKFDDFDRLFESSAYHMDEPFAGQSHIPNFYLSKLARESGVSVVQVGEGSDDLFCGYSNYALILNLMKFYYPLSRLIKTPILTLLKSIYGKNLHYSIEQATKNKEVFLGGAYMFTEKEKKFLLKGGVNNLADPNSSYVYVAKIYKDLLEKFPQADYLDKMIYLDLKVRLPELLLMRADKMTMANSVEARFPFLDYRFVEYIMSLPTEFKYRHNKTKYIFKESLKGILPQEIISQRKQNFSGNPANIFNKDFQKYVLEIFKETEPLLSQWFNLNTFKDNLIFNSKDVDFRKGKKVWSLFSLMLWVKRFLK